MEFCQENALVIANTLFQQHERRLYTCTSPDGQHQNHIDYTLCSQRWRSSMLLSRFSRVRLFATLGMAAHQAPPSLGFSRQEHWSGLPFPSLEDLPDPGIEPTSLVSPALAGGFFTTAPPGKLKRKMVMPISQGCGGDEM